MADGTQEIDELMEGHTIRSDDPKSTNSKHEGAATEIIEGLRSEPGAGVGLRTTDSYTNLHKWKDAKKLPPERDITDSTDSLGDEFLLNSFITNNQEPNRLEYRRSMPRSYVPSDQSYSYMCMAERPYASRGTTVISGHLASKEILITFGYSFTYENEYFNIPEALSLGQIFEIVDRANEAQRLASIARTDDVEEVSLFVIVSHDDPKKNCSLIDQADQAFNDVYHDPLALASFKEPVVLGDDMNRSRKPASPLSSRIDDTESNAESLATDFQSSKSVISRTSYYTALDGLENPPEFSSRRLRDDSDYAQMLRSKNLWPVDLAIEQNWSGRGQHAAFNKEERKLIDDILVVKETLGITLGTIVQSVRCGRILLARKTISCSRHLTKEQAVDEVAHITRMDHSHVVRVIGTYIIGKELSILLYPVAKYNLEEFLDGIVTASAPRYQWMAMVNACRKHFACLCDAVHYIHSRLTKHMDIKPQNILIQKRKKESWSILDYPYSFTIYIVDFGISRSYERVELIETDGKTSFTRRYAAPEVVSQETRGLPADVFSLGCVFLEMYVALCDATAGDATAGGAFFQNLLNMQISGTEHERLAKLRRFDKLGETQYNRLMGLLKTNPDGDASYHANLDLLRKHYISDTPTAETVCLSEHLHGSRQQPSAALKLVVAGMMSIHPSERPTATVLRALFILNPCCGVGSCQLEETLEESEDDGDETSGCRIQSLALSL